MRNEIKEVKSKSKIVGTVEVTIYETVEELIDNVEESVILANFNKSNVIAAQAAERTKHTPGKMGKSKKLKMAFNLLTSDEMISCQGDFEALEALAITKFPEVEAQIAAEAGEDVATSVTDETE